MIAYLRRLNLLSVWLIALALFACAAPALISLGGVASHPFATSVMSMIGLAAGGLFSLEIARRFIDISSASTRSALLFAFVGGAAFYAEANWLLPSILLGIAFVLGAAWFLALLAGAVALALSTLFLPDGIDSVFKTANRFDEIFE